MAELVCPYCYEGFRRRAIEFRCTGQRSRAGKVCARSRDERLQQRTGLAAPVPPAFSADGRRSSAVCPDCGGETSQQICPICHSLLPVHFGGIDSRLIAMVGGSDTGKTVYMTVLLHELTHRVGQRFDAAVDGSDDETRRRFTTDYQDPLYSRGQLFGATQSAAGASVRPLVFRFTTERDGWVRTRLRHVLLSFFDTAGEDLTSQDKVEVNARYLSRADGIILLLDPLQMPAARSRAAPGARLPELRSSAGSPQNVLSRVTQLLRARPGMKPTTRIGQPIAVSFSKLDALWHEVDGHGPLRRDPGAPPWFDDGDSLEVHTQMRALLHEWDGGQIDQLLHHHYATYRYFGVSALGETPTPDNRVSPRGIRPYRVADPLLWLLSRLGAIPAKKA